MKQDWRPIKDLTEEEKEHLQWIQGVFGKGNIRDYCVRFVHVCPECNQARGWKQFIECSNCGHKLNSPKDFFKLEEQERWEHLDRLERIDEP